jgi:hypothetical protein
MMFKIPVISNSTIKIFQEGYGYVYLDADVPSIQFNNLGLDSAQDALATTVSQVYQSSSHVFAMYNDEGGATAKAQPDESVRTATSGHTKVFGLWSWLVVLFFVVQHLVSVGCGCVLGSWRLLVGSQVECNWFILM